MDSEAGKLSRRSLLLGAAGLYTGSNWIREYIGSWWGPSAKLRPPGAVVGAAAHVGHLLRDGHLPPPTQDQRARIVIVGGGIAGLAAAWKLYKSGVRDFILLELDDVPGGNARSGENDVSPYPWGAHYLPIPTASLTAVNELLDDLGLITGRDSVGRPIYEETALCADPQERLLVNGGWQEGMVPRRGLRADDHAQIAAFFAAVKQWKQARGADGKAVFALPVDASSQDPEWLQLDRITMAELLEQRGWRSPYLRWYVNYCCRDDYGCRSDQTSAWAGIHYFAARVGQAANAHDNSLLTWPDGNGHLVKRVTQLLSGNVRCSSLVFDVALTGDGRAVDYYDASRSHSVRVHCDAVIFAAPRFVAARSVSELREQQPEYLREFSYAPWLVANVTVDRRPGGRGAPLSWDNVAYRSPSLGYVVAGHQDLRRYPKRETVLTYYWPLTESEPAEERKQALERSHASWSDLILADLEAMHRGITRTVKQLDVWVWGHAMIRPVPGFLWGEARHRAQRPLPRLWFAHSDMSGISIFEEAWTRGVGAAEDVMQTLGVAFSSSLASRG